MKKIFTIFIMICLVMVLSSCDQFKFTKAFEKLSEENYTMQGAMRMDMKMTYMGKNVEQTMVADLLIQSSPTEVYSETKMNGAIQKSYVKIDKENSTVTMYTNEGLSWKKENKSLEEYKNASDSYFLDIETKDVFTLKDDVWVGNTEIITSMLEKYMDDLADELGGSGAKIKSFTVEKYNIEMNGSDISKLDIAMTMEMVASGVNITVKITMPMEISSVGSTTVSIPEGLPA